MMRKITLIAMSLSLAFAGFLHSQVLLDAPLTDGAVPAGWLTFDEDGVPADSFFVNQSLWAVSEWTGVNFGGTFGVALYSPGEFETVPTSASDWLITEQVTLGSSTDLSLELLSLGAGCTFEIAIATTIAGASPVPADFTTLVTPSLSLSGTQTWDAFNFDLSAFAGQSVYLAFVNTTEDAVAGNNVKLVGIRNIQLFQAQANDARVLSISLGSVDVQTTDYLVTDFNYASYSCNGNAAETVTVEVENFGLDPIDTFDFFYIVDTFPPIVEQVIPAAPIAAGGTYTHTFTTTADFLTAGDLIYFLDVGVDIPNESDTTNNVDFVRIFVAPTHDFNVDGNYLDNFDRIDFGSGQIQNFNTSWGWTLIDANNDGITVDIAPDLPAGSDPLSGDFTLHYLWNDDGTTEANEYAFAPCMDLETGVGYKVSVQAACGEDQNAIYPESFRFVRNSTPSNTGATIIADHDVDASTYEEYASSFVVPTTGTYFVGLQINSPADRWFLNVDEFTIETFTGSPVAALGVSGEDELNGSVYVMYCDSSITVSNASTGIYDDAIVDWGDGNTEPIGTGSLNHTYTAFGTYTVSVIASNILGADTATATVELTSPPAPTVTFGPPAVNGTTVGVTVGSTAGTNVVFTPSCSRVIIDWGDGTIDEVTGTNSGTHTYGAPGSYTIEVTVIGTGQVTDTQTITITGIEEINFAEALNIFPNPSNEFVNVSFGLNAAENIEMTVYSVDGKVIDAREFANTKDVNTTFNTSSFNNGVYLLQITTDNGASTQKFVVSHK